MNSNRTEQCSSFNDLARPLSDIEGSEVGVHSEQEETPERETSERERDFVEHPELKGAEERVRDLLALREGQARVLEMIANSAPLRDVLSTLLRLIESRTIGMIGSILLLDKDGIHVRHGAAPNLPEPFIKAIDGLCIGPQAGSCGTAMYWGEIVIVEDILLDPRWEGVRNLATPHGLRACWSAPIFSSGKKVMGAFAMYYREVRSPSSAEMELMSIATHLAGIAIERWHVEAALVESRDELQQSEAEFRAIFERAATGIAIVDLEGRLVRTNGAMQSQLGYSEEELRSTNLVQVTHPDDWQKELSFYNDLIMGRRDQYQLSKRLIRKDGQMRWINLAVSLLRDRDGKPQYALGLVDDITERKEAEDRLRELSARVLRLQEEERRRIARELHDSTSQLLTALTLNLGVLKRSDLNSDRETKRLLACCLELANDTAQEIRTFSYLLHPPLLEEFGFCGALREYVRGFGRRSGIRVIVRIPKSLSDLRLPRVVESTLFRIVQESLTNVRKHSKGKAVAICVGLHNGNIGLRITDNGRGIKPEILTRIQRGEAAGFGVGISGMRERVAQLRGRMKVRSAPGGTSVQVMVPVWAGTGSR